MPYRTMNTPTSSRREDEIVRSMIEKENEFINHRITWLMTVQGLLFASLGFAWDKANVQGFMELLCVLGIAVSIIALCSLTWALIAIARLCDWWEANKPSDYRGPNVIGMSPPKNRVFRALGPPSYFPILFIIAWLAVLWMRSG